MTLISYVVLESEEWQQLAWEWGRSSEWLSYSLQSMLVSQTRINVSQLLIHNHYTCTHLWQSFLLFHAHAITVCSESGLIKIESRIPKRQISPGHHCAIANINSVQVCEDGVMKTICSEVFTPANVKVLCRAKGFSPLGIKKYSCKPDLDQLSASSAECTFTTMAVGLAITQNLRSSYCSIAVMYCIHQHV